MPFKISIAVTRRKGLLFWSETIALHSNRNNGHQQSPTKRVTLCSSRKGDPVVGILLYYLLGMCMGQAIQKEDKMGLVVAAL